MGVDSANSKAGDKDLVAMGNLANGFGRTPKEAAAKLEKRVAAAKAANAAAGTKAVASKAAQDTATAKVATSKAKADTATAKAAASQKAVDGQKGAVAEKAKVIADKAKADADKTAADAKAKAEANPSDKDAGAAAKAAGEAAKVTADAAVAAKTAADTAAKNDPGEISGRNAAEKQAAAADAGVAKKAADAAAADEKGAADAKKAATEDAAANAVAKAAADTADAKKAAFDKDPAAAMAAATAASVKESSPFDDAAKQALKAAKEAGATPVEAAAAAAAAAQAAGATPQEAALSAATADDINAMQREKLKNATLKANETAAFRPPEPLSIDNTTNHAHEYKGIWHGIWGEEALADTDNATRHGEGQPPVTMLVGPIPGHKFENSVVKNPLMTGGTGGTGGAGGGIGDGSTGVEGFAGGDKGKAASVKDPARAQSCDFEGYEKGGFPKCKATKGKDAKPEEVLKDSCAARGGIFYQEGGTADKRRTRQEARSATASKFAGKVADKVADAARRRRRRRLLSKTRVNNKGGGEGDEGDEGGEGGEGGGGGGATSVGEEVDVASEQSTGRNPPTRFAAVNAQLSQRSKKGQSLADRAKAVREKAAAAAQAVKDKAKEVAEKAAAAAQAIKDKARELKDKVGEKARDVLNRLKGNDGDTDCTFDCDVPGFDGTFPRCKASKDADGKTEQPAATLKESCEVRGGVWGSVASSCDFTCHFLGYEGAHPNCKAAKDKDGKMLEDSRLKKSCKTMGGTWTKDTFDCDFIPSAGPAAAAAPAIADKVGDAKDKVAGGTARFKALDKAATSALDMINKMLPSTTFSNKPKDMDKAADGMADTAMEAYGLPMGEAFAEKEHEIEQKNGIKKYGTGDALMTKVVSGMTAEQRNQALSLDEDVSNTPPTDDAGKVIKDNIATLNRYKKDAADEKRPIGRR